MLYCKYSNLLNFVYFSQNYISIFEIMSSTLSQVSGDTQYGESAPNLTNQYLVNDDSAISQMKSYFLVDTEKQDLDIHLKNAVKNEIKPYIIIHNDTYFAKSLNQKLRNRYFILRHGESEANKEDVISSNPDIATKIHGLTERGKEQARNAAPMFMNILGSKKDSLSPDRSNTPTHIKVISSDFTRAKETAEIFQESLTQQVEQNVVFTNSDNDTFMNNVKMSTSRPGLFPEIVIDPIIDLDERLRERWFGTMDGATESKNKYAKIWQEDKLEEELMLYLHAVHNKAKSKDAGNNQIGYTNQTGIISPKSSFYVESVHHVRQRVCDLIMEKERLAEQQQQMNTQRSNSEADTSSSDRINDCDRQNLDSHGKIVANEIYVLVAHGDTLQILQTAFSAEIDFDARKHRSLPHLGNAEVREMKVARLK